MNLNELHNIEAGDWTVGDILSAYYNTTSNDLFDAYVYINWDQQNKFHWKYFATDNENEFSDKR